MHDDSELIKLVLQDNQQAFAHIIDKYKVKLYSYLYRMIGDKETAQDLAQEVFTKVYYHLHKFELDSNFSAWLFRIAHNACMDELARKRKQPSFAKAEIEQQDDLTPERLVLKRERQDILQAHMKTLPEEYQVVLLLRHTQELSYQEISEILGVSVNIVQVRLHRARKKLRENLLASKDGGVLYEMLEF